MAKKPALMLPVVSLGAKYLAMGYLMRRNIRAFKAPPKNRGYNIICVHPDPKRAGKQIRLQVKSRYQTDSDEAIVMSRKSLGSFDYLIAVFLNIGYFFRKARQPGGVRDPEFYTLPQAIVRKHLTRVPSGMDRLRLPSLNRLSAYKNENGFELIARVLGIEYPRR